MSLMSLTMDDGWFSHIFFFFASNHLESSRLDSWCCFRHVQGLRTDLSRWLLLPGLVNIQKKYGTSPFLMRCQPFSMAMFNSFLMLFVCLPEGKIHTRKWGDALKTKKNMEKQRFFQRKHLVYTHDTNAWFCFAMSILIKNNSETCWVWYKMGWFCGYDNPMIIWLSVLYICSE